MSNPCVDLRQHEFEAAMHGGAMAGEYLAEIGKTDLAKLSEKEWQRFCVLLAQNAYMKRLELDTKEPF
jgi:hypothetical protein